MELITLVLMMVTPLLSIYYAIDVVYNWKKYNLKVMTRHRNIALVLFVSCFFLFFFHLGMQNLFIASSWIPATLLWFAVSIFNNRDIRKLKENQ
jgi:hypothetical protein